MLGSWLEHVMACPQVCLQHTAEKKVYMPKICGEGSRHPERLPPTEITQRL